MIVLAAKGISVPMEDNPRAYITEVAPEGQTGYTVADDSSYYARRIADGDLVEVVPAPVKKGVSDGQS